MIEAVKQWAFTLVITAVFGSIVTSVTISENSKNIKKYVKFACAVVALIIMISPLYGLFQVLPTLTSGLDKINSELFGQPDHEDTDDIDNSDDSEGMSRINELVIAKTSELLKERISAVIYQKMGIKPDNIYIYITQKDMSAEDSRSEPETGSEIEIEIEKAEIYMPENTLTDSSQYALKETEIYLRELLNCDNIIINEIGAEARESKDSEESSESQEEKEE